MNSKHSSSSKQYLDDIPVDRRKLVRNWFKKLIIYDLGLHIGQDTEYYLKKGFRVLAIEANPTLCEQATLKFQDYIDAGMLTILNVGVSNAEGSLDFYINTKHSEWSSFNKGISGRSNDELMVVEVEVTTLEALIDQYGVPYYIKIDIEGNDAIALESIMNSRYHVPYISVENGSSMLEDLNRNHYSAFKYIQQNNVSDLKEKYPALEGKYISHQFEFGASGQFAEETDGPWLSYPDVYKLISKTWDIKTGNKNPDWDDGVSGWFDLHARHDDYNSILLELINLPHRVKIQENQG